MKNIAIITGASSGIGKELLLSMPEEKVYDEIWVVARNKSRLEALKEETQKNIVVFDGDLSDNGTIARLLQKLNEESPCVKLLINSSGYGKFGRCDELNLEEQLGMIDLNCKALTHITLGCLPYMDKGSEIIEIASLAGYLPIPYINVYSASKAYVLSFTRALKSELKSKGINVLAVCPFWTKTQFFARAKSGDNEVVKHYFVMYDPKKVARKAWKDLKRKKLTSNYGFVNKMLVFLSKITPTKFSLWVWKKVQGLK